MIGLVLAFLAILCGCATTMRNLSAPGAKLPVKLGVKFETTKNTLIAMDEKVRPEVLKGLSLGFLSVIEIQTPPPYNQELFSDNDLDGVAILYLKNVHSYIPILLNIEGYSVTYKCDLSIYGQKGNLIDFIPLRSKASFRSPVISGFNDKAKLSKLGDKAANNLSVDVLEILYNTFK